MIKHILFVYNANSSLFAQITDYAHKLLSPQTYQCNLCKLTYDNFGMKRQWKNFIQKLPYTVSFLHKDEFIAKYQEFIEISLPAVFIKENQQLVQVVTSQEINKQHTLEGLENLVLSKLR